ncbi:MAG: CTP synthase C-terminal region-related (seleno)protein [Gemmatimonadales bacterium]
MIGDHSPGVLAHQAIPRALSQEAAKLAPSEWRWVGTDSLAESLEPLGEPDAIWCVPASPYRSEAGALRAIRHAREGGIPFLGTCGGFQHAVLEFTRNVLRIAEAAHAETHPDALFLAVTPLHCSLVEADGTVTLRQGSRLEALYGRSEIAVRYHCRYGLAGELELALIERGFQVTGRDPGGEVRALELDGHPFFVATLFQPERGALEGGAVPPARGLLEAALARRATATAS